MTRSRPLLLAFLALGSSAPVDAVINTANLAFAFEPAHGAPAVSIVLPADYVCAIVAVRSTAKDPDRQAVAVQEAVRRLTTAAQRSAAFQLHQGPARFFTGGANSSASYAKPGYTPGSLQANLRILAPLTHRRRDLRSHPPDRPVRRQDRIPRRGR